MGRVYIKRIEASNFTSHKFSELQFSPGNVVFLGENGAGKTSILNQIMMSLYSLTPVDKKYRDLVRRGTNKSRILLEFQGHDNASYIVEKEFSRAGNVKHIIYSTDNTDETIGEGVEGVKKEVEKLLGISDSTFKDIVYAQQGEIQKIGDSRSRKGLFDRLLGFEKYSIADGNLSGVKKHGEREIIYAEEEKRKYAPSVEELPREEAKLKQAQLDLSKLEMNKNDLKKKKSREETRLEELRPLKARYDELKLEIEKQTTRVDAANEQVVLDTNNLEKSLGRTIPIIGLPQTNELLVEWNNTVNELQKSVEEDEIERDFLTQKYNESYPVENELNERYIESRTEIKNIFQIKSEMGEYLDQDVNEKDLGSIEENLKLWREESTELIELIGKDKDQCNFLKSKRERMRDIETNIEHAESNLEISKGYKNNTENLILKIIPESSGLEKIKRLEYAEKFEDQRKFLYGKALRYSAAIGASIGVIGLLGSIFQLMIGIFLIFSAIITGSIVYIYIGPYNLNKRKERIEILMKDLNSYQESILSQKEKIRQMKMDLEEFLDYDWSEIDRLEEEIQKNTQKNGILSLLLNLGTRLRNKLFIINDLEIKIKENLKVINQIFQDFPKEIAIKINSMIEEMLNKMIFDYQAQDFLFYDWNEIKRLEIRIQENKDKIGIIKNYISLGESLKASLENLEGQKGLLNELQNSLELLMKTYTPGSFEETEIKIQELNTNLASVKAQISNYKTQIIPQLTRIVNDLREDVKRYSEAVENEKRYYRFSDLVNILRDSYKEIPRVLRQEHVDRISRYASDLFQELNPESDITEISIDIDYNIQIRRFGDYEELNILSGGESVVVCLTIRLAFIRALSSCDIAILDEPTAHLDKNRIQELVTVLSQERPIYQLFVVTHNSDFEQVGDVVYKIKKNRGETETQLVS